ncbi:MAG TPA: dynamin family protein [Pyrinomonadaceae bacterium]|nr:dynamin family protein [Pyrinomonadaceae bacterium]
MNTSEQIVDERIRPLIEAEKRLLNDLQNLAAVGGHDEDTRQLSDIQDGIDELFLLVIVGEFNSGKSSFINALFGQKVRVEGPVPVDDRITILRYAAQPDERQLTSFVSEKRLPVDFLRNIAVVDTPGTNSVIKQHQEVTEDFIPRADLILFTTSIDRPMTESERQFLAYVQKWGKKIVIVLNKIDTKDEAEVSEVVEFVDGKCRELLGFKPLIFPVSAKLALGAKLGSNPRDWTRSRFESLEDYVFNKLGERERLQLKLLSPLDSGSTVAEKLREEYASKLKLLAEDSSKISHLEEQLSRAHDEMQANFQKFVLQIDAQVVELRDRGADFLERNMRISNINLLRSETRFREEFERQVLGDWREKLDRTVNESVDWIVRQNMRLWNDTLEYFNSQVRKTDYDSRVIGRVGGQFVYDREEVHARIRHEAENRVRSLDHREECRRIIGSSMTALHQSFGLGAGAVGLGYVLATAFTTVALDVTGIAAATLLFTASFFILPYKRKRAIEELRSKVEKLREEMKTVFENKSLEEIDRAVENVRGALDPYTRFVKSEQTKLSERSSRLTEIIERLKMLKREIENLVSNN